MTWLPAPTPAATAALCCAVCVCPAGGVAMMFPEPSLVTPPCGVMVENGCGIDYSSFLATCYEMKTVNADLAKHAGCDEDARPFQHAHRIFDEHHRWFDIAQKLIIFSRLLLIGCHTLFDSFQFCRQLFDFDLAFLAVGNHFFAYFLQLFTASELVSTNA